MIKINQVIALSILFAAGPLFANPIHEEIKKGDVNNLKNVLNSYEDKELLMKEINEPAECFRDYGSHMPLFWAVLLKNIEMVKLLLDYGAKKTINWADEYGRTTLFFAALNSSLNCEKSLAIIKLLLANGAKNKEARTGYSAIILAAQYRNLPMAKLLLEYHSFNILNNKINGHGNRFDSITNGKATPLYWAVINRDLHMTKLFLFLGANVTDAIRKLECDITNPDVKKLIQNHDKAKKFCIEELQEFYDIKCRGDHKYQFSQFENYLDVNFYFNKKNHEQKEEKFEGKELTKIKQNDCIIL